MKKTSSSFRLIKLSSLSAIILWLGLSPCSGFAQTMEENVSDITGKLTEPALANPMLRSFTFEMDSEFYVNQQQLVTESRPEVTSAQYFNFKYELSPTLLVRVVPIVEMNDVPQPDRATSVADSYNNSRYFDGSRIADSYIALQKTGGHLFHSDPINTDLRYYFPLGEISQETHSAGRARMDMSIPWAYKKWVFSYYLNPRVNFSTDPLIAGQYLSFREYAVATYNFTSSLSTYAELGHRFYSGPRNFFKATEEDNVFETGGTYALNKHVSFTIWVTNVCTQGVNGFNVLHGDLNNWVLASAISY